MTHEELRDYYELYAMGAAGEPEKNEIREHLGRGCEVCMAEMKQARKLASADQADQVDRDSSEVAEEGDHSVE